MLVVSPAHATGRPSPFVMSMAPWTLVWMPGDRAHHPDRYVAVSALGHHVVLSDPYHGQSPEEYFLRAVDVMSALRRIYAS